MFEYLGPGSESEVRDLLRGCEGRQNEKHHVYRALQAAAKDLKDKPTRAEVEWDAILSRGLTLPDPETGRPVSVRDSRGKLRKLRTRADGPGLLAKVKALGELEEEARTAAISAEIRAGRYAAPRSGPEGLRLPSGWLARRRPPPAVEIRGAA